MLPLISFCRIIFAGLLPASYLVCQNNDAFVGTWRLNLSRSKSKSAIGLGGSETIKRAANGLRVHHEWTTANGKEHLEIFTCVFDGKEHAMEREADAKHSKHTVVCKWIDERTVEVETVHDSGVLTTRSRRSVSADGQRLEVTYFGVGDQQTAIVMTAVYDRQPR